MKETELRKVATCFHCHKKIAADNQLAFYRVRIERHFLNTAAIARAAALETMLTPQIAKAIGPDEEMTLKIGSVEITICQRCSIENVAIAILDELANQEPNQPPAKED